MKEKEINEDRNKDRFIETIKFIEARSKEMEYFENYLKKKSNMTSKSPLQKLPKHMRRRAMSHNRNRIPSRIRKISKTGFAKNYKKKSKYLSRKTARKKLMKSRTDLVLLWKYNNMKEKNKILETHQFQAKRMKMQNYLHHKIAFQNNNKIFRTAYNFSKTHSVVFDKSFYSLFIIRNIQHISRIVDFFSGNFKSCFFSFESEAFFYIFVDPFLGEDFCEILNEIKKKETNFSYQIADTFNLFEIVGENAFLTLGNFFNKYQIENKDKSVDFMNGTFSPLQFPHNYQKEFSIIYDNKGIKSTPFEKKEIKKDFFNKQKKDFIDFLINYNNSFDFKSFFDTEINPLNKKFEDFKKKTKLDQSVKKENQIEKPAVENILEKDGNLNKENGSVNISNLFKSTYENEEKLSIETIYINRGIKFVLKNVSLEENQGKKKLSRIILITPSSTGNFFLKNIIRNNSLLVGKKEYDFLMKSNGFKIFPDDYLNFNCCKKIINLQQEEKEIKYINLQPQYKFNFWENNFPYPFGKKFVMKDYSSILKQDEKNNYFLDFDDDFVIGKIKVFGKGKIEKSSLLYELEKEDYENLKIENKKEKNSVLNKILTESHFWNWKLEEEKNSPLSSKFENIIDYKLFLQNNCKNKRNIIGQVVRGEFDYNLRKPSGICYIEKKEFFKLSEFQKNFKSFSKHYKIKEDCIFLWIRCPKSLSYKLVYFEKDKNN